MRNSFKRHMVVVVAAIVVSSVSPQARAVVYDFEGLTLGALGAQDNWTNYSGSFIISAPFGASGNSSFRDLQGGNPAFDHRASRNNNGTFAFPTFTGTETDAVLQFDLRLGASQSSQQISFGVGRDLNGDGVRAGAGPSPAREIGPAFGATWANPTPQFFIFQNGASTFSPLVNFSAGVDAADWIRLRLVMDLTANAGAGAGSLFYQDLTDGATSFTPVAGLQNFNLTLNTGPAASTWNALYVEGTTDTQLDNLFVVPEPSTAALACLFAFLATASASRRQKSHGV